MELKDPMVELLSSLEQIVLTRDAKPSVSDIALNTVSVPEPQRLREMTGMQVDEFARVMGVSVSSVKSWDAPLRYGTQIDEAAAGESLSGTAAA